MKQFMLVNETITSWIYPEEEDYVDGAEPIIPANGLKTENEIPLALSVYGIQTLEKDFENDQRTKITTSYESYVVNMPMAQIMHHLSMVYGFSFGEPYLPYTPGMTIIADGTVLKAEQKDY